MNSDFMIIIDKQLMNFYSFKLVDVSYLVKILIF